MNRLSRIFSPNNNNNNNNNNTNDTHHMDPKLTRHPKPKKLERRNAAKNIEYFAKPPVSAPASMDEGEFSPLRTRSLDLSPSSDRTSFRIDGSHGEVDLICRTLGLTGPEDFAIPEAEWEARKIRSSSDLLPRSRLLFQFDSPRAPPEVADGDNDVEARVSDSELTVSQSSSLVACRSSVTQESDGDVAARVLDSGATAAGSMKWSTGRKLVPPEADADVPSELATRFSDSVRTSRSPNWTIGRSIVPSGGGGIKGIRPPVLAPPPGMLRRLNDTEGSTWDILRDLAPSEENSSRSVVIHDFSDEEECGVSGRKEEERHDVVRSRSCSFTTTSNDDDSSTTTTERSHSNNISPDTALRRQITDWQKGDRLGSGSFGTVYEGIAEGGFFFAVKEVSLLDQGSQGRQSILQLQQEIDLLSTFEHENIVRYLGTQEDESKLYIFLELVTQGSLVKTYQKYQLRDTQVSAYTRQILYGLKYLHDRNVLHRDIKCANILVHANGSVKLADFGLAKATKLNDIKSCKGTPYWMAPEVVNGKNQGYGLAADIWSLGCTVLEMLTGQIPYSHLENHMQALWKIGKGEPPQVPESLSLDARDFILQCLQVNAADRPTAGQLLDHPFVKRLLPTTSGSASPLYISRRV